ncbi:preprotein translocase subunit YajC [Pseudomonas aeruginosa]|nr:preprotein translocase subunit YajC [Pseudomonas aeruginosa]
MSFLIPAAYADAAAPAAAGPAGTGFEWVFLVGFLVIFYLMIWRPQAKRAKEHKNLLGNLQKGDEVVTSGGIAGKVTKVADDFVVVEVSDNVELKFQKAAIAATLPKGALKAI